MRIDFYGFIIIFLYEQRNYMLRIFMIIIIYDIDMMLGF